MQLTTRMRTLPAMLKSWWDGVPDGAYRPAAGLTELGNWRVLDPLDGTGFQSNLSGPQTGNGAVFSCANVNAQTCATVPVYHKRLLENNGQEIIVTSALSRILRNPNEYQTRSDFIMNLVFALMFHGNAYAYAVRNARQEVESMHLLPPRNTLPYVDAQTKEVFYALGDNPMVDSQYSYLVPARDVLHVRLYCPKHPLVAVSPISYAGLAIMVNTAIGANQAAFFNNMSRPSGILSTEQTLTAQQMADLRAAFEAKSKNAAAGGVPILGWGIKWLPMTITSEDAQLIEAYRLSIEDIARVFRVPLALVGEMTKATYSNTEQLISSWLATGLGFLLEHIESSFAKFFKLPAGEIVDFDVSVLLRTEFLARVDGLTKAISGGLMSPNEARAREGLPAVEYGSEPRLQAQVVPLSQVGATPVPSATAAPAAPVEVEEPEDPEEAGEEEDPTDPEADAALAFAEWTAKQAIMKAMAA